MKILWVKSDFLHPTTKGGQIRTLEMLRCLHRKHEIHYVAYEDPAQPEGFARSREYCSRAWPVPHRVPEHRSCAFLGQLATGVFSSVPVSISRYHTPVMQRQIAALLARERFDRLVCDFLVPALNLPDLRRWVLFQHNIETMIWRRHSQTAADPFRKWYFHLQAERMFALERRVCRNVAQVVAVSAKDAAVMRSLFGISHVSEITTGVDVEYFTPPVGGSQAPSADLVFVGSMDWLPNIDGVLYFVRETLPLIRRRIPTCSLAVVGRKPSPEILALAREDARITVTGTVPDVRPYLWGARLSIVPLRIGGGTRLKIYESMAAGTPVVSSSIGAEGLEVQHPANIRIADNPQDFATHCLELLDAPVECSRTSMAGRQLVSSRFSWEQVATAFERILDSVIVPVCGERSFPAGSPESG
jgi:glycosyltransferase involved in cell wall biosynthesis